MAVETSNAGKLLKGRAAQKGSKEGLPKILQLGVGRW